MIVLDVVDRAFSEDRAFVQYRDFGAEAAHERHIVLDDDDRPILGKIEDQACGLLGLTIGHARDRLVEQQERAIVDQQHADFEPLLLTMAQITGRLPALLDKADAVECRLDTGALGRGGAAEKVRQVPRRSSSASSRLSKTARFSNTVGFWNLRPMPRLAISLSSSRLRSAVPTEKNLAGIGAGFPGDDIHHCRFAGSVRADDGPSSPSSRTSERPSSALNPSKLTVTPSR